jgi:hypothetical protein
MREFDARTCDRKIVNDVRVGKGAQLKRVKVQESKHAGLVGAGPAFLFFFSLFFFF